MAHGIYWIGCFACIGVAAVEKSLWRISASAPDGALTEILGYLICGYPKFASSEVYGYNLLSTQKEIRK